jgi:hypothetical protein
MTRVTRILEALASNPDRLPGYYDEVFAALFHTIREIQGSKIKTGHNVPILNKIILS